MKPGAGVIVNHLARIGTAKHRDILEKSSVPLAKDAAAKIGERLSVKVSGEKKILL